MSSAAILFTVLPSRGVSEGLSHGPGVILFSRVMGVILIRAYILMVGMDLSRWVTPSGPSVARPACLHPWRETSGIIVS